MARLGAVSAAASSYGVYCGIRLSSEHRRPPASVVRGRSGLEGTSKMRSETGRGKKDCNPNTSPRGVSIASRYRTASEQAATDPLRSISPISSTGIPTSSDRTHYAVRLCCANPTTVALFSPYKLCTTETISALTSSTIPGCRGLRSSPRSEPPVASPDHTAGRAGRNRIPRRRVVSSVARNFPKTARIEPWPNDP